MCASTLGSPKMAGGCCACASESKYLRQQLPRALFAPRVGQSPGLFIMSIYAAHAFGRGPAQKKRGQKPPRLKRAVASACNIQRAILGVSGDIADPNFCVGKLLHLLPGIGASVVGSGKSWHTAGRPTGRLFFLPTGLCPSQTCEARRTTSWPKSEDFSNRMMQAVKQL